MITDVELINQRYGKITSLAKQRVGNKIFSKIFLKFDSEEECKEFCNLIGNDARKFITELNQRIS